MIYYCAWNVYRNFASVEVMQTDISETLPRYMLTFLLPQHLPRWVSHSFYDSSTFGYTPSWRVGRRAWCVSCLDRAWHRRREGLDLSLYRGSIPPS